MSLFENWGPDADVRRAVEAAAMAEAEAPATRVVEAAGKTIDADDDQWRKLTGDAKRDLAPLTQSRMQKLAHYQWESNLLANRLIELPLAFLLAEGVTVKAANEDIQKVIKRFWKHPINNMDIKLVKKARELALFGEQCYPAFVNEFSGAVQLGYLDPSLIATVVTDPDNIEQPIGIVTVKDKTGNAKRFQVIVNGDDAELFTKRTQDIRKTFTDGQCFYFKVNDLSCGRRGRSDLLAQIDWLDNYEEFLFGESDRARFLRAWVWTCTLKGATQEEVEAKARTITAPAPGSVRVKNESEEWGVEAPTLNANDSSEAAKLFRNHNLGGATIPEHWFGGASDVNRSTGDSMGEPTFKVLSMRQTYLGYMLHEMVTFVIRQKVIADGGEEPDMFEDEFAFEVQWPEMVARDTTKYAAALAQVVVAAVMAIEKGLLSKETAVSIINKIAGRLGVEIDAKKELVTAMKEMGKQAEEDVFVEPPEDGDE